MEKYEFTGETKTMGSIKLHRIRALRDFSDVKAGDEGGWIEKEDNLSQDGNAWVCGSAEVRGNAWVCGSAEVCDNAVVCDNACVRDKAVVCDNACVRDKAWVCGNAVVRDKAVVCDNACVRDKAWVCGSAEVCDNAVVCDNADYMTVSGLGSVNRTTTVFRTENGLGIVCGCFCGNMDKFREKVKETHGDSKYAKEYLLMADLVELHFNEE